MKDVEGFNVYVMPIETAEGVPRAGRAAKITSLRTFTFGPVWSPDGREIAFGSAEGGTLQIWRIAPDGSNLRRVDGARLRPGPRPLQWGPGREIIYASAEGNQLRRLDPESNRTEPLVLSDTLSSMDAPVWSPDGQRVAVRVHRGYEDSLTGVWIASRERLETQLLRGWEFVPLGWAEDGRRVFLTRSGQPDLYAVSASGGTPRVVTTLPFESPQWTDVSVHGSGKRVLYTRFSDRRDLWLVEPLETPRQGS
jgi:Tol biopolymer transport system component